MRKKCVINNITETGWVESEMGVRQGCVPQMSGALALLKLQGEDTRYKIQVAQFKS